jgi:hypothetical protein
MKCSDHPTQRLLDGRELLQDIDTVASLLHHPLQPFDLTLNAVQAREGVGFMVDADHPGSYGLQHIFPSLPIPPPSPRVNLLSASGGLYASAPCPGASYAADGLLSLTHTVRGPGQHRA